MKLFIPLVTVLALAAAKPSPQQYVLNSDAVGARFITLDSLPVADVTSATTSSLNRQIGLSNVASHEKTVSNGHSSVHRFQTHVNNPSTLIRRRRPVAVTRTVDPFSNTVAISSQRLNQPAVVSRSSLLPQQQIFQTADGRFFTLANDASEFQANQIFQTSDGRTFRIALSNEDEDDDATVDDVFAVADAARSRPLNENEDDDEEEIEEEEEEPASRSRSRSRSNRNRNKSSSARTTILSAPLTTNNARFISTVSSPQLLRTTAHHALASPTVLRTVSAAPVAYSNADTVSNGYFVYGNAGVAFEF